MTKRCQIYASYEPLIPLAFRPGSTIQARKVSRLAHWKNVNLIPRVMGWKGQLLLNVVFFFTFLCVLRIQVLYGGETWTQTQIQTCFRFIRRLFFPDVTKKVEDLQVPFSPHHSFDGCCFHSKWLVPIHYEWDYLKIFGYPPWLDCQTAKL